MHVAYIHQHFSTKQGATGTRSYEMAQRLIAAGHRVTMICGVYDAGDRVEASGNGDVTESKINDISIARIGVSYGNRMGFLRRILAFGQFARKAERIVAKLNADLVFATSTPLTVGLPGMKGARKLGVPFVFEVRDRWPEIAIALGMIKNPALIWYTNRMERQIYAAANRVVALSPGILDGICSTGYPRDRVTMIPNASDLGLFTPNHEQLDDKRFGSADDFKFVFTGAHGLANGLDSVLEAALELKRRHEKKIKFIMIGDGRLKESLVLRSKREGLSEFVSWLPLMPKQELAIILPKMDVGLMMLKNLPAFYFGTSPNKFFDYIASGLPILNNYPGWLAGLIEKHECGCVVNPDNPAAFADAVVWMRDHKSELTKMGTNARHLAESQFSRDKLADQFIHLLEQAHAEFRG